MRRRLTAAYMREPKLSRDGTVSPHEAGIRMLIDSHPDMRRNGFQHSIRQLWAGLYPDPEDADEVPTIQALPDAFRLDRENQDILIYEVEVTNPLSAFKLYEYGRYWSDWDCDDAHEWLPRLFVVNRYGHIGEIDLVRVYHDVVLKADAAALPEIARLGIPEAGR